MCNQQAKRFSAIKQALVARPRSVLARPRSSCAKRGCNPPRKLAQRLAPADSSRLNVVAYVPDWQMVSIDPSDPSATQ
jgi:hypothetical protein